VAASSKGRRCTLSRDDPHIHVERKATYGRGAVRNLLASEFGLVPGSPAFVVTGCGRRVPYAMTSARPECVTCLACREHAHLAHLEFARMMEALDGPPGFDFGQSRVILAEARRHRDIAHRFVRDDRQS
jgi:hypothetical protein